VNATELFDISDSSLPTQAIPSCQDRSLKELSAETSCNVVRQAQVSNGEVHAQ